MRYRFIPQMTLGAVPVKDIEFDLSCRHELVPILMALQHVYVNCKDELDQILDLIRKDISKEELKKSGCRGMNYWETLVISSVRLGCDMDFDQLSDLASNHIKLRQMLGLSDFDKKAYPKSTINENYRNLTKKTIDTISGIIVGIGHEMSPKALDKVRGDSFVSKKNIHYPTDTNLLYDGVRKTIDFIVRLADTHDLPGWRKHKFLLKKSKAIKREIERVSRSRNKKINKEEALKGLYTEMIEQALEITERALDTVHVIQRDMQPIPAFSNGLISELFYYIAGVEYISDLAHRRIVEGETILNPEKVFSLFEPDTELINRGKTPNPIEFGHRVLVIQDNAGFIVHSQMMDIGFTDEKIIVEVMRKLQERFNDRIRAASFDKGFWTPNNLKELSEFIPLTVLPKKGKRTSAERDRESSKEFVKVRKWHSGIESAIHALGSGNGLTVCRDKGVAGYDRYIAMGVLGRNLHTLGSILLEKKRKKAKPKDPLLALCM